MARRVSWTILARYAGAVAIVVADTSQYADWGAHGQVDVRLAAKIGAPPAIGGI